MQRGNISISIQLRLFPQFLLRKYIAEGVHLTIFLSSVSLSLMGNGVLQKLDALWGDPGPFNFWINENNCVEKNILFTTEYKLPWE